MKLSISSWLPKASPPALRGCLVLSLCAALIPGRSAFAQAPLPQLVPKPFTLKLGAYFPTDSGTKDATGNVHFLLSATFELGKTRSLVPFHYGLYADGIFRSSKSLLYIENIDFSEVADPSLYERSGSLSSSGYAIGVFGRYFLSAPLVPVRPYAGLGVGFYSETETDAPDNLETAFQHASTRNGVGGKAIVGLESKSGLTGEVSYNLFPSGDGVNLSGIGVTLGCRF